MISLAQEQQQQHNHSVAMAESRASSDDGHYSLSDMMLDDEGVDDATVEGSHSVKEDARRGMAMSAGDDDVPKAEQFTVRLIFPHEDGGVLIGKEGRHITKLKEATKATWLITSNNSDREDRVVILRGAVDHISQAIHELSKHLCTEARHPTNPGSLLLRYLFPFRAIGAIVGPGGSYIEELRAKPGVQRLHIYKSTIPFTQERVVEVGATPEAMQMAAEWLVDHTKSNLTQLQELSTLYKPVRDGLRQFLAMNQRAMAAEASEPAVGRDDSNRKRSRSMIGLGHVDSDSKRLRRQSEEGRARSGSSPTRYSRSSRHSSTSGPKRLSTYTAHAALKSDTKEKLVVPDRIAGRLIGRNGT
ncbi:PAB1 binding protein, partial [Linderina pennispora]